MKISQVFLFQHKRAVIQQLLLNQIYYINLSKNKDKFRFIYKKLEFQNQNILFFMENHTQFDFYVPQQKIFGQQIKQFDQHNISQKPFIVLSGFPYDEGTKRNGGRVGGAVGSYIFRKTLSQHQIYPKQQIRVFDAGDILKDQQLQKAHQQLFQKQHQLLKLLGLKGLLFSIGGSNDQSYPNVRALMELYPTKRIGVVNIDQHFDVRPLKQGKAHSGSPFRQMIQHQLFQKNNSKFVQFAVKGATTSKSHYDYLIQKKADVYWLEKDIRRSQINTKSHYRTQGGQIFQKVIKKFQQECDLIFVSFDVDSINCKWMPGVSAPSVIGGLSNQQALQIMEISGKSKKVNLIDFSEFNPAVQSLISSRLLVEMFFTFVEAFHSRQ